MTKTVDTISKVELRKMKLSLKEPISCTHTTALRNQP